MNKLGIYIVLIVIGVAIGAIALIYYNPFQMNIETMDIPELTVTQMEFTTLSDSDIIIVHATNRGTKPVTVVAVKINGDIQNKITVDSIHGLTFEPGDSRTFTIEHDWITGNSYTVSGFTSDGSMPMSITDTA
jgi:hypothetical protein